ncbi:hypothetical protein T4A_9439 [Trichinella pseudospiralis]|uniref:Uncharacterized protein n=1 Tax=Trichinella pseudospiralis TaxID=6337 RepID=A0A0V1DQQ1_TRIPS|nr:hypothetical protein T4A_9439 [Trichinella pseudospiralis]
MEEEFLGGLHHAPVKIYIIAPGLSMLQQFCLKKAAMGLVKRMQQNWERTTFDMTKWLRENASIFVDRKQHRLCQNASKVAATEQTLAGKNVDPVQREKCMEIKSPSRGRRQRRVC